MPELRLAPTAAAPNLPIINLGAGQSKTIGRGRQADVVVDDASLSRLHARVTVDSSGQLAVDDLGSTNGTTYVFADVGSAPATGDYMVVRKTEIGDVGTIHITPDPEKLLPSGITTPIAVIRDAASCVDI